MTLRTCSTIIQEKWLWEKNRCFYIGRASGRSFNLWKLLLAQHKKGSKAIIKSFIKVKVLLTVAGDATSKSMGSKMRLIWGDIWMISPLIRQSFLLSSSTVFMFSIHTASTGPSKISHFLSGLWQRQDRIALKLKNECHVNKKSFNQSTYCNTIHRVSLHWTCWTLGWWRIRIYFVSELQ